MKRRFLFIFALTFALASSALLSKGENKSDNDLLRRSTDPDSYFISTKSGSTSYPVGQTVGTPFLSTGYYFVDSTENVDDYWKPKAAIYNDTRKWVRIQAGPRILDSNFWSMHPDSGLAFFRNPAVPANGQYFSNPTDSTVNAFAGPIPIGFPFYLNGVRYDSFYVSSTGAISFSNRRYYYDANGNRTIPPSSRTGCYDFQSEDWMGLDISSRKRDTTNGYLNSINDPIPDNFGYLYNACGNNIATAKGGIRNNALTSLKDFGKIPIVAPFYGNVNLSQLVKVNDTIIPDDYSKVFYRNSADKNELCIYFEKILPTGTLVLPGTGQSVNFMKDSRPWYDTNYVDASAWVYLNRTDSSVTIKYQFNGKVKVYNAATGDADSATAEQVFSYYTFAGINGRTRSYVNNAADTINPWKVEYQQTTTYNDTVKVSDKYSYFNGMWVKFKQWKNALKPTTFQYFTRTPNVNADLLFSNKKTDINNFEMLAGDPRLGEIQPAVIIQNVTNDAQGPFGFGINYQKQNVNCRVQIKIDNVATNETIFSRYMLVNAKTLSAPNTLASNFDIHGDSNAIVRICNATGDTTGTIDFKPLTYALIKFPSFKPSELLANHVGRFKVYAIVEDFDTNAIIPTGEQWHFDDTISTNLNIMKRLTSFDDDFSYFDVIGGYALPDAQKWVSLECNVVDGEAHTNATLAPKELCQGLLKAPVLLLDRKTLSGADIGTRLKAGGDEIRSFPIDLGYNKAMSIGKVFSPVISFSYHRGKKMVDAYGNVGNYRGDWTEQTMYGPESRVILDRNVATDIRPHGADELWLDFARPNGINEIARICNIPDTAWTNAPNKGVTAPTVANTHIYVLYGGSGYKLGYSPSVPDSILPTASQVYPNVNDASALYETGVDEYFNKVAIKIPQNYINYQGADNRNFRFRFKNNSWDHTVKYALGYAIDDNDPFYIDNVRISMIAEKPDVELTAIKVFWPYSKYPASQATQMPVTVVLSNNSLVSASATTLQVRISKASDPQGGEKYYYCRSQTFPVLSPLSQVEVNMPTWNAKKCPDNQVYKIAGTTISGNGDDNLVNNYNYTLFNFKSDSLLAYDYDYPDKSANNDVARYLGAGRGLTLEGVQFDGVTNSTLYYSVGTPGGSKSGQFAVKFQLMEPDTIFGFETFFGSANQSRREDVIFAVYPDNGTGTAPAGGDPIANSELLKQRGMGVEQVANDFPEWNKYISFRYKNPLYLPAGTYWMAVSQQAMVGVEIGGTLDRMGAKLTHIFNQKPQPQVYFGSENLTIMMDRTLKEIDGSNKLMAVFQNVRTIGEWTPFNSTMGNWSYHYLSHYGIGGPNYNGGSSYYSRSCFLPLLRTYFGKRATDNVTSYVDCTVPVELSSFNGVMRNKSVDLYWETASEVDNSGFNIERREVVENKTSEWSNISFVKGQGNSSITSNYSYNDINVVNGKTYQYRLRQVDFDNTLSCEDFSKVLTFTINSQEDVVLNQNSPNPFTDDTKFSFSVNKSNTVNIEVLDLLGSVVKNIFAGEALAKTNYEKSWDGTMNNGERASNGTYILRMTVGNTVKTLKMSLVQ